MHEAREEGARTAMGSRTALPHRHQPARKRQRPERGQATANLKKRLNGVGGGPFTGAITSSVFGSRRCTS
jgi:hypothetical protein